MNQNKALASFQGLIYGLKFQIPVVQRITLSLYIYCLLFLWEIALWGSSQIPEI